MKRLLALEASAGTGKTFALSLRYLGLLLLDASIQDILAITFTNKAANEMRSRVESFLFEMDDKILSLLSHQTGLSEESIRQKLPAIRSRFLSSPLGIMTIDSFVQKILRKFSYYAGVASDFEIGSHEGFEIFLNALGPQEFDDFVSFAKWFDGKKLEEFFDQLYEMDKELPAFGQKRYSDKTDQVMHRYHLLAQFIQAHSTEAKQKEFGKTYERVEDLIYTKSGTLKAWIKKNSLCETKGIRQCEEGQKLFEDFKKAVIDYLRYKEERFLHTLFDFYRRYRDSRLSRAIGLGRLDFIDIKHLSFKILQEDHLNKDFLYFRIDSRIDHILFDEFQDTSWEDWKIFEPLADEIASGGERLRSFFYVGDKKQAIYGFRGGNAALFDYVAKRYGMDVEELDVNYRSASNIVEYVNEQFDLEQKSQRDGGYVEVGQSEDILETLQEKLRKLFDLGIPEEDIAILVHTNNDIYQVAGLLESMGKRAITSSSKMVIHQPRAKGIIDLISYLYHKEKGKEEPLLLFNFVSYFGQTPDRFPSVTDLKPVQAIKKVASHFDFWDESVELLMQEAIVYKDIEEFVHQIDQLQTQMPNSGKGVEVMTVHKSKGLAFKHVIVLDTLGVDRNRTSKLIMDREGVKLEGFYLRMKERESIDPIYAQALEKEQKRRSQEIRNVAYVALTRAQESLFVIKKPKSQHFWFLQEACMGALEAGIKMPKEESKSRFNLPLRSFGLQEFVEVEEEYEPNDYQAIYLGNAYHQAMEIGVDYVKSRYPLIDIDWLDFQKRVEEAKKLEESLGQKSFREIPFILDGSLGIIDQLFVDDKAVIVDYKSATPKDQKPYIKQVNFYKSAISRLLGKPSEGYLLYLDTMKLQKV